MDQAREDAQIDATTARIVGDTVRNAAETKRVRGETWAAYAKAAMFLAFGVAALALSH